ncbi:MAG: sigma 54-interacting transcriptional regulator [Rickettsiales bacterium]
MMRVMPTVFSQSDFLLSAEDSKSKAMLEIAQKAAKSHATILLTGETGVGKEVMAHYIHHHSPCANGPFVSVNCAALPENMVEAILFGYERGAFTNAVNQYMGKFEQAQHGTLLLDEISEIPLGLQAKLLRVLQEREVERLGGKRMIPVDVRIIAATNRDLEQQVISGLFREDLYYRLNVLPIHCPALRERPSDIIPLAEYFLRKYATSMNRIVPTFMDDAKVKLLKFSWPGNIREMDNVIQRCLIMTEGELISADDLAITVDFHEKLEYQFEHDMQFQSPLEETEANLILSVLRESEGCRNKAAEKLNISPRTLRYKLSKLRAIGLQVPQK